jgi:hypothetical protein
VSNRQHWLSADSECCFEKIQTFLDCTSGDLPLSSQLKHHAQYVWTLAQPKLQRAYEYAKDTARQAVEFGRGVASDVLGHETTQSLGKNVTELRRTTISKYKGSLKCI